MQPYPQQPVGKEPFEELSLDSCDDTARLPAIDPQTDSVAAPAPTKQCRVCGDDVTGRRRAKDRLGRYYCYTCALAECENYRRAHGIPCTTCRRRFLPQHLYNRESAPLCQRCYHERLLKVHELRSARLRSARSGGLRRLIARFRKSA